MASKKNIIKRKNIPLTIVRSAKRCKIKQVKAQVRGTHLDSSSESLVEEFSDETVTNELLDAYDSCIFEEAATDETDAQQPSSSHTKRKQKASERWEFLQSVALNAVVTTMAKRKLNCTVCNESAGVVKCYQCGPQTYYCESCAIAIHQNSLFHHYMEIWQVRDIYSCSCSYM